MNWYIGQEIVAVKDHTQGAFKKGDQFTILALRKVPCKCSYTEIDIGHKSSVGYASCSECGARYYENFSESFFHERSFAPLQTDSEKADMEESLTEIFERELFV